ncbi:MAG: serine hydrolase [Clostridium sp.]|jgi:D-alanyl-D-alanine carboxypeptidase (penicillin-binding protein 5/6)
MLKQLKRKGILALACVISIFSMSVCAFAKPDWPLDTGCQSEAGIVMDLDSGAVLFAQNIHVQEYPASITKLLTALVVVENASMDEQVTFSHDAVYNVESGSGNKLQLEEGDVLSVKDCLYVMLLQSSNQAANALAEHVGGSREAFADMMNEKAASLGCRESHFVNPSGLNDPEQLTSAYDMAQIGAAVFGNPTLLEICSTTSATLPPTINNPNGRTYSMEHKLVVTGDSSDENYYPSAVAGKTGYTSLAGQTLVTYAEQDGRRQVAVTLKSTQRTHYSDTKTILDFGFARFKNVSVAENETDYVTGEEPVTIGDETYSPSDLYLDEKAVVTLPNDAQFSDADKYLQTEIPASHPEGAVARIIYTYNDRQIGVAWVYSTKAASAPVSAEDGTDNETAGSENTTDAAKTGTSSTADKEKKPLKLTKATYIAAGAGVVVLLIAAAVVWFMIQRKQEEERMRVLREKRRKRLADMGCSEEEFERLVNERKNALRERTMPEPDDDDGSGDEVSDHSEDLPEEYPDDEYDSWEDEHEDDLDDPDEKEDVPGEDR